ncbi:hypothetical protein CFK40_15390 [Virgibacillus necropolis]|uniref:Lysozyme inhibitor LprI-like N-terminal domain-containing protein n=2 Tax=Virgibacillus necropolis TaxID=163877 RepID=A0A221MF92_9BACI|nr:hypothetical protein CFK40_15390 [Virgibacillus necropolis]
MKNNHKFLMVMLTVVLVTLAACSNSSAESNAKSNNGSSDSSPPQNANGESLNKSSKDTGENKTKNSSEDTSDTQINEQEDSTENTYTDSNDEDSLKSSNSDSDIAMNKEEYLKKLNKMEEADKHAEAKTTIVEMEEQEAERYKKWDAELNEIYGILKEQLSTEQMDKFRKEQRDWIKHRDKAAKEASLKYKGGSTESLEYVATQGSLTRERCYELVAKYMK